MWPHLCPGDRVLIDPSVYRHRAPCVGEVVVADHPFRSDVRWVKRVVALTSSGALELVGDNPDESTDSRTQGAVPLHQVRGRVTSVLVNCQGAHMEESDRRG